MLNEKRVRQMRRRSWVLVVIGFLTVLELVYMIGMMIKTGGENSFKAYWMVFAFIILPWLLIVQVFFRGIYALFAIRKAKKYAKIFEDDQDGLIPVEELKRAGILPAWIIRIRLGYLLKKKLFTNIRFDEAMDMILVTSGVRLEWRSPSYLIEQNVTQRKNSDIFGLVFSLIFLWFFSLVIPMSEGYYSITIPFSAVFVVALILSLLARRRISRLLVYDQVFEKCSMDEASVSDAASAARVSAVSAVRDIEWALRKRCMRNCYVDRSRNTVVLADVQGGYAQFAAVKCTHCGVSAKIRSGRIGKCSYCGSMLAAPKLCPIYTAGLRFTDMGSFDTFCDKNAMQKESICRGVDCTVFGFWVFELLLMLGISGTIAPRGYVLIPLVTIAALALGWLGVIRTRRIRITESLANLFPQMAERRMNANTIAEKIGVRTSELTKTVQQLIKKKLLKNCSYENGYISLTDPEHQLNGYYTANCPNCGAELRMQNGHVVLCRYCGAFLDQSGILKKNDADPTAVMLYSAGEKTADVLGYLKNLTGMPMNDLMQIMDLLPAEVAKTSKVGADRICEDLKRLGAVAETKNSLS